MPSLHQLSGRNSRPIHEEFSDGTKRRKRTSSRRFRRATDGRTFAVGGLVEAKPLCEAGSSHADQSFGIAMLRELSAANTVVGEVRPFSGRLRPRIQKT
jgi:hypothetical protein